MTCSKLIGVIILTLLLPIIVSGRSCFCSKAKSRADNAEKELAKAKKEIEILTKKIELVDLQLGDDFALSVSTHDGRLLGYIYDDYNPSMNLPPNSKMQIIARTPPPPSSDNSFVRLYYDINQKGLFIDLPVGQYNASKISFPKNSVSSVNIPTGYQVVLYAEDDFKGEHAVLSGSTQNLNMFKFNDKMQSIEIMEQFLKKTEHMAVAYSHISYSGKPRGLVLGKNINTKKDELKSISIQSGYEVLIYTAAADDSMTLIEIVSTSSNNINIILNIPDQPLQVVVQPIQDLPTTTPYVKLYADIDFKGFHFYITTSASAHLDGSLSSIQIPFGFEAVIYEQPNNQGAYVVLSGEINNLHFYAFNDRAKSIIVQPTRTSREDVVIYSKPNYLGEKMTLPIGRSDCSFVKLLNFCSEAYAASIKVPSGFKATLTKAPTPITLNERVYTYNADSHEIRNYVDTFLISVVVEHV